MAIKTNSFVGISSGTGVTTGNSGGASGTAFDAVTLVGSGVSVTANTSADLTAAYDRGMIANSNGQTTSEAMVQWNHTATSTTYHRMYFRTPASAAVGGPRLVRGYSSTTVRWDMRYTTTGVIGIYNNAGSVMVNTNVSTGVLAANTIYRIEWKMDLDADNIILNVYLGDALTSPLPVTVTSATANIAGTWDNTRYGVAVGGTTTTLTPNLAALGWSDTALIGPTRTATAIGSLPALTGSGAVLLEAGLEVAGAATLPALTGTGAARAAARASGAATLPKLTNTGSGMARIAATGAATLPPLSGTGTGLGRLYAAGTGLLPALTGSGILTMGFRPLSGANVLPALTGSGTAHTQTEAAGAGLLPALTGSGALASTVRLSGAGTLPALTGTGQMLLFDQYHVTYIRVGNVRAGHGVGSPRGTMTVGISVS